MPLDLELHALAPTHYQFLSGQPTQKRFVFDVGVSPTQKGAWKPKALGRLQYEHMHADMLPGFSCRSTIVRMVLCGTYTCIFAVM